MRSVCSVVVFSFALASVACGRQAPLDSLLLVTIDTVRADHISCYGRSPVATPNIDRVAREGALVERAWTPVPLTTPAHASILTGLYPQAHGVRNNDGLRLPSAVETLAETLRRQGRSTAAFVSSITTSRLYGLDQGFETFADDMGYQPNGRRAAELRGDVVVNRAIPWLESHARGPFFLWVHLFDAHAPYEPPPEFAATVPGDAYSGEIAFVDLEVGRLLQGLQNSGAAPRTVVVVVADHGEGFSEHGESGHGCLLYEEALRVPFVLEAPGRIAPGTRVREPASIVDLVPTVLSLLRLPAPAGVQGIDLFGPARGRRRGIYAETLYPFETFGWSPLYAYRQDDVKVIASPRPELYDLASDPREITNLAELRTADTSALLAQLKQEASDLTDATRLTEAVTGGPSTALDAETLDRLRSLGYVAGGRRMGAGTVESLPPVGGRNPRDAMGDYARFWLASTLVQRGRSQEAATMLESLRAADPGNPRVLMNLAIAYQVLGRDAAANSRYAELLERHPTFYLGYQNYCLFLRQRGQPRKARDLWLQLAARVPGFMGMEAQLAQASIESGLAESAASRLENYLKRVPGDADSWYRLGEAREKLNDPSGALEAYRHILEIQPTAVDAARKVCALLVAAGRRDEAIRLVDSLLARTGNERLLAQLRAQLDRN